MAFEAECPICDAVIPLEESEVKVGEIIYCSYCLAPLMITQEMIDGPEDDGTTKKVAVEEEWEGE